MPAQPITCTCDNCPGDSCTCGCRTTRSALRAAAGCGCGDACTCGPDCSCQSA